MERGMIAVSFGTSVPEAQTAVEAVENALRREAPGYSFARAFTSPTIRRVLAGRGERVPSLTEALEALRAAGVRRAAVQPTHLLYGVEYDKLKAETEAFAGAFDVLALGRPLLADTGDIKRFAARLSQAYPLAEGSAAVFMGHGTDHFANAVYPALQTGLRLEGRGDLLVASYSSVLFSSSANRSRYISCTQGSSPRPVRVQQTVWPAASSRGFQSPGGDGGVRRSV